jgi:hypothetical protein
MSGQIAAVRLPMLRFFSVCRYDVLSFSPLGIYSIATAVELVRILHDAVGRFIGLFIL